MARGPDKTAIDLAAHGMPTLARHRGGVEGVKVIGADITVDKLACARHDQAWSTTGPATVKLHDGVELAKLELASGAQHLGLDAKCDAAHRRAGGQCARAEARHQGAVALRQADGRSAEDVARFRGARERHDRGAAWRALPRRVGASARRCSG